MEKRIKFAAVFMGLDLIATGCIIAILLNDILTYGIDVHIPLLEHPLASAIIICLVLISIGMIGFTYVISFVRDKQK